MRLSLLYRIPRRELQKQLDRDDVLELMAYDTLYGLPDRGDGKLPAPPIRRRTRIGHDNMAAYRAMKAMCSRQQKRKG